MKAPLPSRSISDQILLCGALDLLGYFAGIFRWDISLFSIIALIYCLNIKISLIIYIVSFTSFYITLNIVYILNATFKLYDFSLLDGIF